MAGQERYKALAPMYYRGAAVAVVVVDITNKESFDSAKCWVAELRSTDAMVALAGNKCDLSESRAVQMQAIQAYADAEQLLYMETSAKTGKNVQDFFKAIAGRLPKKEKDDPDQKGKFKVKSGSMDAAEDSGGCCS